jgi:polyisoprenoid-binding protein YceI
MNEHAKKPDIFDVAQYPTATFKGNKVRFKGDTPVAVDGDFTLHGVTRPLTLTINKFKCIDHPMLKREVCGADASATFQRSDYGVTFGLPRFSPEVKLAIQVEAVKQ